MELINIFFNYLCPLATEKYLLWITNIIYEYRKESHTIVAISLINKKLILDENSACRGISLSFKKKAS